MIEHIDHARSSVRPAQAADASHIARIHNESIAAQDATMQENPTSIDDARELIEDARDKTSVLIIEASEAVLGWGRICPYGNRHGYRFAAETAIFIDRAFRRRGLGSRLQSALIEEAGRLGYHHLVAKVFADNSASVDMHVRLGHEVVGIQREIGYKNSGWKDVAVLQYVFRQ